MSRASADYNCMRGQELLPFGECRTVEIRSCDSEVGTFGKKSLVGRELESDGFEANSPITMLCIICMFYQNNKIFESS